MQAVLRALDEAPLERARALVQRALTSWRFYAHVSGQRKGDYPVAVLDPKKSRYDWLEIPDIAAVERDGHREAEKT